MSTRPVFYQIINTKGGSHFELINESFKVLTTTYIPKCLQQIVLWISIYTTIHIFFLFTLTSIVVKKLLSSISATKALAHNDGITNKIVYSSMILLIAFIFPWRFIQSYRLSHFSKHIYCFDFHEKVNVKTVPV